MAGCLLAGVNLYAGTDSLAFKAYTMGGGNRESGQLGIRLDSRQSVLFNITSNCNTAQCQHGMAGIRIDNNGNMIHARKIGSAVLDVDPRTAIYTSDKHILLVGSYTTDDRLLLKMDTMFNVVWTRMIDLKPTYDVTVADDDIKELNGRYYLVMGNQFVKLDTAGNVLLCKHFGALPNNPDPDNEVNFYTMQQLGPDRFFVAGSIIDDAQTSNFSDYGLVAIIDTNGTVLKQKKIDAGAPYDDVITHAFKVSNNQIKVFGHWDNSVYMADVDSNLAVSNAKKLSGANIYNHSVCYNGTDRFLVSAYQNTTKTYAFAVDNNGAVLWSKGLNNGAGYFNTSCYRLSDCAFAIYGSTTVNTAVANKGFWMKLNENGLSASTSMESPLTITATALTATATACNLVDSGQWQTNFTSENFIFDNTAISDSLFHRAVNPISCPEVNSVHEIAKESEGELCAPNPFSGSMSIGGDWELNKIGSLRVYDITGRTIYSAERVSSKNISFDGEVKGLVFVKWEYEGVVYVQKMIGL